MEQHSDDVNANALPDIAIESQPVLRWGLFAFGLTMVAMGLIGVVVPGMPTTVFLIIAAWAFSRSSPRFQKWLWYHPRLGPSLRNWYHYKIIPMRAKYLAISMMSGSLLIIAYFTNENLVPFMVVAAMLIPTAIYICTRPSDRPVQVTVSVREES
ncbi:MAG: YbaN family protein [Rhodospirillales bacterium]|jgi:uncharacterized protein|nr:YbaN family protein [Rhodospirillales bacterium]MBT4038620.1 YbaN family protein [Rhodospirillales bacterium]MBT4627620.1 YbaN family protein [Rhodospirillales bacterium]MBT5351539.1 YbaN family protein [Rhodospirillales bacterium]MBT5521513.1 YbaN family protein [Rhodospirillales bacterium]